MIDPFSDAASLHFEADPVGSATVNIIGKDGETHFYDKVNFVVIDREPFVFGMRAVEREDGNDEFVPVDTFPLENVQRIRNAHDLEFIEDYES